MRDAVNDLPLIRAAMIAGPRCHMGVECLIEV
jgi:hypothetical protein